MKVLVIGSGGREHALCLKFSQSPKVEKIYCAPGNGGISKIAELVDLTTGDFTELADFAKKKNIDITFVGPESPLSEGIVDFFVSRGLKIVGPAKDASKLESSKIYAKEFMKIYGIPTAPYRSFSSVADALNFLDGWEENKKVVVKADGLAAGKGVYMCDGRKDAHNAVKKMMEDKVLGGAGSNIVIEEHIDGQELSYLIFTDGISYSVMPASQDHKRAEDGDKGLNTGGMGAYSPAPLATNELNEKIERDIIRKVIEGIKAEKLDYKGVLYVGIIMNGNDPYVLEFNCRFGDPETQVLLPLLETDLLDISRAIVDKRLSDINISWKKGAAVCVVLASGGYPENFEKGFEIKGLEDITDSDVFVYHAGTKSENGQIVTSGGRVLGVTAIAGDIKSAVDKVYENVKLVSFENMRYRKDIAKKALSEVEKAQD
ncbi:MAG: phosphoribosylamine--glycine ligase [Endomicrobium sp.]|jgi:phosphoribosylamine--glycine ligase|nr:phosphoribosylamine--glycine ligase [Endomicrobium sp.]